METINLFLLIIVAVVFLIDSVANFLNVKYLKAYIPDVFRDFFDENKYFRAIEYTKHRSYFYIFQNLIYFIVLAFFLIFDIFRLIEPKFLNFSSNIVIRSILYFIQLYLLNVILQIPFHYYKIFKIEQKFGFNKMNKKVFLKDTFKIVLLNSLLIGILAGSVVFLVEKYPTTFILTTFLLFFIISITVSFIYPILILPMFNKLTPLNNESLKNKLYDILNKIDFALKNIYVIDGSKRSTKANAFLTGLGKNKRIILFDTILELLNEEEILAVITHELGHKKKNHIYKLFFINFIILIFYITLLKIFINVHFFENELPTHIILLYYLIFIFVINYFVQIVLNYFSRKFEVEADDFTKKQGLGKYLVSALKKLTINNLSVLEPHPLFYYLNYSHPTTIERIRKLEN